MTAVFAFAFGRKAVIASDTLRVDPLGLFPDRTVQKSYCWKNLISFGGAGTGAFIQQVAENMWATEAQYSADEAGFLSAFEDSRARVMTAINSSDDRKKKASAHGVALASVPELSTENHILRLDFATGEVTTCYGQFAAEGTRPSEFTDIAATVLSGGRANTIRADRVGLECMSRAVSLCPKNVGWPMDLRVVASSRNGSHEAFHVRIDARMPASFLTLRRG